jgi:hypothetical protein
MISMSQVRDGVMAASSLSSQVIGELDPEFWAHQSADPVAAAELADYVVGATQAVGSNLQSLAVHFENYKEVRFAQESEMRMNLSKTGKPYPAIANGERYSERALRLVTYERSVFVSIGSVLDTLTATLIGYAGLELDIHHADYSWLLPMDPNDYPSPTANRRLFRALAPEGTAARARQIEAIRAFMAAIDHSGPAGWVDWAIEMRNMFVHREHRSESVVVDRVNKTWQINYVPAADPTVSSLAAFLGSKTLLDGYYLKEDVKTTMSGLIDSLNASTTGVLAVLTKLWDDRKMNPSLISQPSSQWKKRTQNSRFEGYLPGSALIKKGVTMYSHPQNVARFRSGGLFDESPDSANGSSSK